MVTLLSLWRGDVGGQNKAEKCSFQIIVDTRQETADSKIDQRLPTVMEG